MTTVKTYRLRSFVNGRSKKGREHMNFSLTVPTDLASTLNPDQPYTCEVLPEFRVPDSSSYPDSVRGRTIKGILYTPADPATAPDWVAPRTRPGKSSAKTSAKKTAAKPARKRPGKAAA